MGKVQDLFIYLGSKSGKGVQGGLFIFNCQRLDWHSEETEAKL